jgi:hypothetical protein
MVVCSRVNFNVLVGNKSNIFVRGDLTIATYVIRRKSDAG